MTVRTDNDEWYHAAHGLHDHAHHQAHRPMDICVPLWSRFRVEAANELLGSAIDAVAEELDSLDGALDGEHPEGHLDCDVCRASDRITKAWNALVNAYLGNEPAATELMSGLRRVTCDYCGGTDHTDEEHEE